MAVSSFKEKESAFVSLTAFLAQHDYTFICPTPESQARVVRNRLSQAATSRSTTLEDFFGWSLPADESTLTNLLSPDLLDQLRRATIITANEDGTYHASFRLSNFHLPHLTSPSPGPNPNPTLPPSTPLYYIHSPFPLPPTTDPNAVFFGPDTYFFLDFLRHSPHLQLHLSHTTAPPHPPRTAVDVCCGAGAGAIELARLYPDSKVIALDLNARALELGRVNATLAGVGAGVEFVESDLYAALGDRDDVDLVVSNPPYIASSSADGDGDDGGGEEVPVYAAGGAQLGLALPTRLVEEGVRVLAEGALLVIYTGVPMAVRAPGRDAFLERLRGLEGVELLEYRVIHPDMWAEEVGRGAYADVGRIQVVGAVMRKRKRGEVEGM